MTFSGLQKDMLWTCSKPGRIQCPTWVSTILFGGLENGIVGLYFQALYN